MSGSKIHLIRNFKHLARYLYGGSVFCAFDTETTGLKCLDDYVIEIGAVKFNKDGVISTFNQLVKPPVAVPEFISNLTGITNEQIAYCEPVSKVLPDFLRFIDNTILVAHNAPFDMGFINSELNRSLLPPLNNKVIDTLPLSRWAYPQFAKETEEKGQYKLQNLAKRFDIDVVSAHRACDDARVCMEVFLRAIKDTMAVQKPLPEENNFLFGN